MKARKFSINRAAGYVDMKLQCDRADEGAEISPHGLWIAGSGKLQCDRADEGAEILLKIPARCFHGSLQCDRADEGAEICSRPFRTGLFSLRFNVTAPMKARKSLRIGPAPARKTGFNVTAPMKARKYEYHEHATSELLELQCDRADEGAEIGRIPVHGADYNRASM